MRGWHAKVLDFGLAQLADAGTKLTAPGAVFGTPRYMAPEQSEGGPLDARVDIYALGLVLFEMLTGKSPFDAPSVSGLMRQQRETPVPRLAEVAAGLGIAPSIDDAIQRATAKRPEDRFPSMVEFARILADALGHAPAAASVEESGPTLARAPSDKPVAPVHDPTLPSSRGRAAAPEPIPLVGGAPRAEPPADGASPRKLAAFVVAGAVAVAIAGLGAWSWRDQRGDRIRVLRAQLDEAYAANREPPPPEACREQDPEVLGKLAFAAHLLDDRQLVSEKRVAAGERAAAALFTAASTRRPEASYLLAKARLDADQLDPVLADAARRCAGFAAAENLAGVLAFRDKRLDDAEERFRAALTLAPGFANARANLGVLRLQQRRFAEAAELLEAAIAQQPDFAKALFALGLTRSAQAQAADEPEKSARLSQDANQAFCKALALGHPAAQAFCKR
jgi:tetratricopeptide (TPR) repeat protein